MSAWLIAVMALLVCAAFVVTLGLGIGANVALFTVVRGVLLKPLPFEDPDRLMMLYEAGLHEDDTAGSNPVAGGMYAEWKNQNRGYSSLALAKGGPRMTVQQMAS